MVSSPFYNEVKCVKVGRRMRWRHVWVRGQWEEQGMYPVGQIVARNNNTEMRFVYFPCWCACKRYDVTTAV